jgi:hypothetical protein
MAGLVVAIHAILRALCKSAATERDAPADNAQGSAESDSSGQNLGTHRPPKLIQANVNKRKQMKINVSKIVFFYLRLFFRINIFQWVTVDSNKKNSAPPRAHH